LFRALKTKHETPKYGLIYHASIVGQAAPKNKGKVSRMVAAKTALATRVDALADNTAPGIGIEARAKIEARMRSIEGGHIHAISSTAKSPKALPKYDSSRSSETGQKRSAGAYNTSVDSTLAAETKSQTEEKVEAKKKKRKTEQPKEEPNGGKVAGKATEQQKKKKKAKKGADTEEKKRKRAPASKEAEKTTKKKTQKKPKTAKPEGTSQ